MEKTIFQYLTAFEEVGGDVLSRMEAFPAQERLITTPLRRIFQPVIDLYPDDIATFNKVLYFILYAYSPESTHNFLNWDWADIKKNVADKVGIEEGTSLHADVVLLGNKVIAQAAYDYLKCIGGGEWKHLCMLKDLYEEMLFASISPIKKGEEIDYDQKKKNSKYASELWEEIKSRETKLLSLETGLLKQQRDELADRTRSLSLEDNLITTPIS